MNFLQKGLAGLESRLDKVLLDEPDKRGPVPVAVSVAEAAPRNSVEKAPRSTPTPPPQQQQGTTAASRISMQDRLAAAMARKIAAGGRSGSPAPTGGGSGSGSRTASPAPSIRKDNANGRGSTDSARAVAVPTANGDEKKAVEEDEKEEEKKEGEEPPTEPAPTDIPLPLDPSSPRPSVDTNGHPPANAPTHESLLSTITQLEAQLSSQSHASSERIDALEEKLRYLARTTAESSRRTATSSTTGAEKRLAEAQEKIALLLEEGEKLSKNELKLQNAIKKLRAKAGEEEKGAAEARRGREKAEREVGEVKERLRRALEEGKRERERVKVLVKVEGEVEVLRREKEAAVGEVRELKIHLEGAEKRAEEAEGRAQTEALEAEKRTTAELKETVERVQTDAAVMETQLRAELDALKDKLQRDAERAANTERELKAEQLILERKLETLRARAEEVSSGTSGDAHAKLLRQVETLQTQYAIAGENWKGIEGCMQTRIDGLEKERDEVVRKEADVRRRAREMSAKLKNLDANLETANSRIKDLESELLSHSEAAQKQRTRITTLETTLSDLRATSTREKETWQRDLQSKLDEERLKWQESLTTSRPTSRPTSPSPSIPHSPFPMAPPIRKSPGPLSTTESYFVGARKGLAQTQTQARSPSSGDSPAFYGRHGFSTPPLPPPQRQDSALSLPMLGLHNISRTSLPAPPATEEEDDYFENIPFSPQYRTELLSVSTIAAGPSVQLVERMSATVRRLESEMAGAREEVAAMTTQRDEARAEIVELVREVEGKRGAEERVKGLEVLVEEMRVREDAALELLGERSEMVEELKADVDDLKQMYRDLVSDTMR